MDKAVKYIEYNTGISMLKIWMAMSIVVCHFLDTEFASKLSCVFTIYGGGAVSVFIFISFLLSDVKFTGSLKRISHRVYRLFFPQLFFAIVYFIFYTVVLSPTNDLMAGDCDIKSLCWQLIFGTALNPPMWYFSVLLILTILFYLIFALFKGEKGIIISILVAGIAIFMSYSGINYRLFCNLPDYSKWTLGRFVELIPIAVCGIIFSYYKVMNKFSNHKRTIAVICLVILLLVYKFNLFNSCDGFYYQGVRQIVIAIGLGCLFWCLPFERLPQKIRNIINQWSQYNVGIIATHYLIKALYNNIINDARRLSLLECLIMYTFALIISVMGAHIPIKYVRDAFR